MAERKTIYCPKCHRRVGEHDGRTSTNVIGNCPKCKVQVVYYVATQTTVCKEIPARPTSSGKTFY